MLLLITYDVNTTDRPGQRRLAKIAKLCCDYGQRVQNSVFECDLDQTQYLFFKEKLLALMDTEKDSLRIYRLGNNYRSKIEQFGAKQSYDPQGELIL